MMEPQQSKDVAQQEIIPTTENSNMRVRAGAGGGRWEVEEVVQILKWVNHQK